VIGEPHLPVPPSPPGARRESRGGHGWKMIACCIPMLIIAIVLVATGVVGAGFIAVAIACTAMMALMMRGMDHGGNLHASNDQGMIHDGGPPSARPPHAGHIPPHDPRAR
jgi:hypothetical protein